MKQYKLQPLGLMLNKNIPFTGVQNQSLVVENSETHQIPIVNLFRKDPYVPPKPDSNSTRPIDNSTTSHNNTPTGDVNKLSPIGTIIWISILCMIIIVIGICLGGYLYYLHKEPEDKEEDSRNTGKYTNVNTLNDDIEDARV